MTLHDFIVIGVGALIGMVLGTLIGVCATQMIDEKIGVIKAIRNIIKYVVNA